MKDDPDDGFSFSNGVLTATWNWWRCCTDGVAISPLNNNSFCVSTDFVMSYLSGIDAVSSHYSYANIFIHWLT